MPQKHQHHTALPLESTAASEDKFTEQDVLTGDGPLPGIGLAPLLTHQEEIKLSKAIQEGLAQLRALVLGSPLAVKELCDWDELIAEGEMTPKEIMPRGRRTQRELLRMQQKLHAAVTVLKKDAAKALALEVRLKKRGLGFSARAKAAQALKTLRAKIQERTFGLWA